MRIRLSDIQKPTEFEAPVEAVDLELGYHFAARVEPTKLFLEVVPSGAAHRVEGRFSYRASVPCSRCLEEVVLEGEVRFFQEFRPAPAPGAQGREIDVGPDDDTLVYYEEDTLFTADLARQQLFLELPEKPLCSEGCRGLCPHCGADLNAAPCDCPPGGQASSDTPGDTPPSP